MRVVEQHRSSWTAVWATVLAAVFPSGCAPAPPASPALTIDPAAPAAPASEPSPPSKRPPARARPHALGLPTCEEARARYIEEFDKTRPPDLSAGAYGAVLNKGSYLVPCGVPTSTAVAICAAVQNGRLVGVTVRTDPADDAAADCIADAVSRLSFPEHPRMDITNTTFAASP